MPPPTPNVPFNNGQPLSSSQVQALRAQYGIKPGTSPTPSVTDQWAKFDSLVKPQPVATPTSQQPGYNPIDSWNQNVSKAGDTVAKTWQGAPAEYGQDISKMAKGFEGGLDLNPFSQKNIDQAKSFGEGIIGLLGHTIKNIYTPVAAGFQAVADTAIADNPLVQKVASSDVGKPLEVINKLNTWAEQNPEKADTIMNAINLFTGVLGETSGAKESIPNLKETVSNLKSDVMAPVETVANKVTDIANAAKEKIAGSGKAPLAQDERLNAAIKDTTPDYEKSTPTQKGKFISQPPIKGETSDMPRVQEGGKIKGRTLTPTALEKEAATELSKVKGYNPGDTKLAKYQAVKSEIATRGQALRTSLANEKIAVPPKEVTSSVRAAVNQVPEESLLLQKSDPTIKNYMRVVNNAIGKSSGTLEGVLDVRQALDDAYENARGKLAYGSEKISALDEIHRAGRDSLTQYLIDHARKTDVKASLRGQWNLYRAADELQTSAERESGSSVGRLLQNNPTLKAGANVIKKAIPFGVGAHIQIP